MEVNPVANMKMIFRKYFYYLLVFSLSLIVMVIFPMLNPELDSPSLDIPETVSGWIMYITSKTIVSGINVAIFACFVQQGELNSINNENYKKAKEILNKCSNKEYTPISPKKFLLKQYGGKGSSILIVSFVSMVALPPLVVYDWKQAITYLLTIITSVIFGLYQMKVVEAYWCGEYLEYAEMMKKKEISEVNNNDNDRQHTI